MVEHKSLELFVAGSTPALASIFTNKSTGCKSQTDSGSASKDNHEGYETNSIYGNARRNPCQAGSTPDHPANFGCDNNSLVSLGVSPGATTNFAKVSIMKGMDPVSRFHTSSAWCFEGRPVKCAKEANPYWLPVGNNEWSCNVNCKHVGLSPTPSANFGWGDCVKAIPRGRTSPNRQFMDNATWKMGRAQSHVGSW